MVRCNLKYAWLLPGNTGNNLQRVPANCSPVNKHRPNSYTMKCSGTCVRMHKGGGGSNAGSNF